MKKLFVITAKVIAGVVGLYVSICLLAVVVGAAQGLAIRISPAGRADIAQQNASVKAFNDRAASSHDQH